MTKRDRLRDEEQKRAEILDKLNAAAARGRKFIEIDRARAGFPHASDIEAASDA